MLHATSINFSLHFTKSPVCWYSLKQLSGQCQRIASETGIWANALACLQLTQKKQKMEYKALDQVLQTYEKETGEKKAITYRCGDMDRIVPGLMGVSKANPINRHFKGCMLDWEHTKERLHSTCFKGICRIWIFKGEAGDDCLFSEVLCRQFWRVSSLFIRRNQTGPCQKLRSSRRNLTTSLQLPSTPR